MDPAAIAKAESRLRVARRAVEEMSKCTRFEAFSDTWYVFLTSAKNIYTVLQVGSKTSPQSQQWFGEKNTFRRNDELLQYIFQARNDDEHGLENSVEYSPAHIEVGVSQPGYSNSGRLDGWVGGNLFHNVRFSDCGVGAIFEGEELPPGLKASSLDQKSILTRKKAAKPVLKDIVGRGVRYKVPTSHLGHKLPESSPLYVANLAIKYLEGLVTDASRLRNA